MVLFIYYVAASCCQLESVFGSGRKKGYTVMSLPTLTL